MSDRDPRRSNSSYSTHAESNSFSTDLARFLGSHGITVGANQLVPSADLINTSNPADRKRRYTGPEPERRNQPHPAYTERPTYQRRAGGSSSGQNRGIGNREFPLDLTLSPAPERLDAVYPSTSPASNSRHGLEGVRERLSVASNMAPPPLDRPGMDNNRGQGEDALPTWQPDADVDQCTVCKADFSFWFRKHHCRKCGRVVCSNCSPHRITIPKQYIVQPNPDPDDLDAGMSQSALARSPLGGGDIVRVCNPCVPDPWTPEQRRAPRPSLPAYMAPPARVPSQPQRFAPAPRSSPPARNLADPPLNVNRASYAGRPTAHPPPEYQRDGEFLRRVVLPEAGSQSIPISPNADQLSTSPPRRAHLTAGQARPFNMDELLSNRLPLDGPYPHSRHSSRYGHRHSQSNIDHTAHTSHRDRPLPSDPRVLAPVAPSRRRQVKEEDECPVCGVELPPGEALREIHVRQCISTRFSSTPVQPLRSAAPPPSASPRTPGTPSVVPEGSRARAASYRPRGMALYRATEKDCTTEDGEAQECVICFEEFEEGDEMGRMECLCKFHRHCIRQWWDTKGQGSCPTHQLHE